MAQSDEEDDYMNMVFDDTPKEPKYETSLQRAARKRKEGEARSRQKTKAERQAEAEAAREAALTTALPEDNKGFKMMAKFGFKQGGTLGKSENARKEPIQIVVKDDKAGIGLESEKKRKLRETFEHARKMAKREKEEEGDFLEERRQKHKERNAEKDLDNAQRTAEWLFDKEAGEKGTPTVLETPPEHISVFWRSRVRRRIEQQREKQQKRELNNSLSSRLPILANDDEDNDNDTKTALGQDVAPFYTTLENDIANDDEELAEFEALPVLERLHKTLVFLRDTYKYCLYCGYQYPDVAMDGCPGITEEDHD